MSPYYDVRHKDTINQCYTCENLWYTVPRSTPTVSSDLRHRYIGKEARSSDRDTLTHYVRLLINIDTDVLHEKYCQHLD